MDQPQLPKNQKVNASYRAEGIKVMGVAFELGFIIALPILAFATLGKWLDTKYGKGYFVYLGIVLAIISTSLWLYHRFSQMIKRLEEIAKSRSSQKQATPEVNQADKQPDK